MGIVNIDDMLPGWVVALGALLLLLMVVGAICSIARDYSEMRVMWQAEAACMDARQRTNGRHPEELRPFLRMSGESQESRRRVTSGAPERAGELRRRNRHGVDLEETCLRGKPVAKRALALPVREVPAEEEKP